MGMIGPLASSSLDLKADSQTERLSLLTTYNAPSPMTV